MLLTNKIILVTGARRGIGKAIVLAAMREGATVIAHLGKNNSETSKGSVFASEDVFELHGDLSSKKDVDQIWQDAVAWKGRVDVLVNNAGVFNPSPYENLLDWEQGWEMSMSINLKAPARFCRHAIVHFESTGEGIIINMASRSAHRGDDAEHLAYGAAKGGLLALTKGIARSFAASGTLAYAIAPAWVRTEMAEDHIATVGEKAINASLPMREITPPSDVAETVCFLASGRARHATGCTIDITGADYVR
ncbi:MAG: SDR family oxidoreductase [Acidiferrobacterales bacterium]|nr:SDR family oxidoreductase [Acidiferrobacterales bacterium]